MLTCLKKYSIDKSRTAEVSRLLILFKDHDKTDILSTIILSFKNHLATFHVILIYFVIFVNPVVANRLISVLSILYFAMQFNFPMRLIKIPRFEDASSVKVKL